MDSTQALLELGPSSELDLKSPNAAIREAARAQRDVIELLHKTKMRADAIRADRDLVEDARHRRIAELRETAGKELDQLTAQSHFRAVALERNQAENKLNYAFTETRKDPIAAARGESILADLRAMDAPTRRQILHDLLSVTEPDADTLLAVANAPETAKRSWLAESGVDLSDTMRSWFRATDPKTSAALDELEQATATLEATVNDCRRGLFEVAGGQQSTRELLAGPWRSGPAA